MKRWTSRRRGFVLPLALIVMILGIVLVTVALDISYNQYSSTSNVVDEVDLYQAALDGSERGKSWLRETIVSDDALPDWGGSWSPPPEDPDDPEKYLEDLLVTPSKQPLTPEVSIADVVLKVYVYDLNYSDVSAGDFRNRFPPRMVAESEQARGFSAKMTSTYVTSNRGEGSTGTMSESVPVAFYMIRSVARQGVREKIVEQIVSVSE